MKSNFYNFQKEWIERGRTQLIENMKIILYKFDPKIFDAIDFDDDIIYQEPLLFAFFMGKENNKEVLDLILYGYTKESLRRETLRVESDERGRVYLPNIGWLFPKTLSQYYDITTVNGEIKVSANNQNIDYVLEAKKILEDTNIELLKYPIPLLSQFFFDAKGNQIGNVEIEDIFIKQKANLTMALNLIKEYARDHFHLIELVTKSCMIFNVDSRLRNSFATQSAHGIAFFNAYQEDYNEVFFVDDIAHQTGHVIFMSLIYEVGKFLKVDSSTTLQMVQRANGTTENRNILVIFHAYYTYYTTFICLDACLDAGVFQAEKRLEALGRISFYLLKCHSDLSLVEDKKDNLNPAEKLFTENGLIVYNEIKSKYHHMVKKWGSLVKNYDLSNQPYNFSYSKFIELNGVNPGKIENRIICL